MITVILVPIFSLLLGINPLVTEDSHTLVLSVNNIQKSQGTLKIAIYSNENGFPEKQDQAVILREVEAIEGSQMSVSFNLNPGVYAVSLFQDLNENDKLDKGIFGIPKEPWGCSGIPTNGPPRFESSKFLLDQNSMNLEIALR